MNLYRRLTDARRFRKTWIYGSLCVILLFGSLSAIGAQTSYAAERTVGTWDELAAAFANGQDGDTIALSNDITQLDGSVSVPEGTSLTLNLNGHRLFISAGRTPNAAVGVPAYASLTIEDTVGDGAINAFGGDYGGAGIGGGAYVYASGGTVTINGGTVHAANNYGGAGIGGGKYGSGGTVTINGGTVNAIGNRGGAGIGGGIQGDGGIVTINDGTVSVLGEDVLVNSDPGTGGGAGIGGGSHGSGGTVMINGGTVNAISQHTDARNGGGAGIGGGYRGDGGTVTINGGIVNATGDSEGGGAGIGGGYEGAGGTVMIGGGTVTPNGYSTIGPGNGGSPFGSLNNGGTIMLPSGEFLDIPAGITVQNTGTIDGEGTLKGEGIIDNAGTIKSAVSGITVSGNNFDLNFDLNGAPGTPPPSLRILAPTVQAVGLSLNRPTSSGYEFEGWFTAAGEQLTDTAKISAITSTGSTTLYARWKDITLESVFTLQGIVIPYGTKLSDIGLPGTVGVTLSNGETKQAAVTWDDGNPAYDGSQPGTYRFTGTLTAPERSTNPDGKTASINVIVDEPTVKSVEALSDIHAPYGTKLSDIGLPGTVVVTLSSGETKLATVTWDVYEANYDGEQPGTYRFMGTLTEPEGSTNPDGKTASVKVIVDEPTVESVVDLPDIHIPYGTKLTDINLPTDVEVTLSSGETKLATVTWDVYEANYDGEQPGTYRFTGTLTAPEGSTNPGGKPASVKVIVDEPITKSVGTLPDIHVPYGTKLPNIGLPGTVEVTLSSGETKLATVTWDVYEANYDGEQPGTYRFTGTLTVPEGPTKPDIRQAIVNVIVDEPTVESVAELPDIHVSYGTKLTDINLPGTVEVTLSSGETRLATVTWDVYEANYDGEQPGTYRFTGTLTALEGLTNPDGQTVSVKVIVADVQIPKPLLNGLELNASEYRFKAGESHSAIVYGLYSDNSRKAMAEGVVFRSLQPEIAFINDQGLITAVSPGTATITAEFGGFTVTATVRVSAAVSARRDNSTAVQSTNITVLCGTEGCTASLGDQVKVSVPAHAADRPFFLTIEKLGPDGVPLPEEAELLSVVFRLMKSTGEPLQQPMTLQIKLQSENIGDDRRAVLFAYDESTGQWVELGGSLNGDVFTAQTDQFTRFAVLSVVQKSVPPSQPEAPADEFNDISGHWANAEIREAVAKGIVTGYNDNTFRPDRQVTRMEFTVMLMRALKPSGNGQGSASPELTLADAASVPAWARPSITEAVSEGWIHGFADGTFGPGELMNRVEIAMIAVRVMDMPEAPETKLPYADADNIPVWAKEAVEAVQNNGVMKGRDENLFAPNASVTRAEAVVLILRLQSWSGV
ncbi:hypothetical protein EHV15_33295 [Paenibacillus oralis]|uniref:SLH domain-containing protein n=1 Tax=Paenibacillus oralis TaxID=2490856 RepID=A0A3P3UA81_9BACL|nr:Ig-like domain-containing protein [Paenibacillus oralis]RRJ67261.1 hypothetical protein EHV15_33295 [Paenibacillus oralis]